MFFSASPVKALVNFEEPSQRRDECLGLGSEMGTIVTHADFNGWEWEKRILWEQYFGTIIWKLKDMRNTYMS